jgi:hypothetical protein
MERMACRFVTGVLPPVVEQLLNIKLIARKHNPIFIRRIIYSPVHSILVHDRNARKKAVS